MSIVLSAFIAQVLWGVMPLPTQAGWVEFSSSTIAHHTDHHKAPVADAIGIAELEEEFSDEDECHFDLSTEEVSAYFIQHYQAVILKFGVSHGCFQFLSGKDRCIEKQCFRC